MPQGRKLGLTPTLMVLLLLGGALTIIGIVIWLRMAPKGVPTQPAQPRSGGTLQLPPSQRPRQVLLRSVVC